MDPTQTSLVELRNAIAGRLVGAVEASRAYLERIERLNGSIHAFDDVYVERALQRAAEVDEGRITGPLAGVPVAIKDNLCTRFGFTRCSSRMLEHFRAPYDATAVARLEAAGAVILGKTVMDEFAMGSSTEHCAFGRCANPWDPQRVSGGSSGGSAAAVAADLCGGALGSDTGGSIRQPAAYCGVVGLKPTYGRISRFGLVAFASSLDQIGPITRTTADAALVLGIVAGHDPLDSTCTDRPVEDYLGRLEQPPAKLRIGLAKQYLTDANDSAVAVALEQAVAIYQGHGAEIVEVDLPHTEYGIPSYYIIATAEASSNLARYDGVHYGHRAEGPEELIKLYCRSRAEGFGDEVKRRIMLGTYVLSSGYYDAYYLKALKVRRLIKEDFDGAFTKCDLILCPTATAAAFKAGEMLDDPLSMYLNDVYTVNGNLAGLPCISLPAGFTAGSARLPVGIQLLAPFFEELRLLQAARLFEMAGGHHLERPCL